MGEPRQRCTPSCKVPGCITSMSRRTSPTSCDVSPRWLPLILRRCAICFLIVGRWLILAVFCKRASRNPATPSNSAAPAAPPAGYKRTRDVDFLTDTGRGRDRSCDRPLAQIRTCSITAYGSYFEVSTCRGEFKPNPRPTSMRSGCPRHGRMRIKRSIRFWRNMEQSTRRLASACGKIGTYC